MRGLITWFLILGIGSMLIGTALADCAALANMSCCPGSGNAPSGCGLCAAPSFNTNAVVREETALFVADVPHIATVGGLVLTLHSPLRSASAWLPPSNQLFKRIHVFLI